MRNNSEEGKKSFSRRRHATRATKARMKSLFRGLPLPSGLVIEVRVQTDAELTRDLYFWQGCRTLRRSNNLGDAGSVVMHVRRGQTSLDSRYFLSLNH